MGRLPRLLSIDEASERTGIPQAALRKAMKSGTIPAIRIMGMLRILESDLQAYLEAVLDKDSQVKDTDRESAP